MTHLSLFSGIGGLDLAAEWAGIETVGQCEWADYPTKVLEKHWPGIARWKDIRTLTKESFYEKTGLRTVDVVSGGFPCQPFSFAGKRRGKADDRYLWPEMARVIKELRPAWVVGENVAGIVRMALDDILSELESEGYSTRAFLIPASGIGALHHRYRAAIIACDMENSNGSGREQTDVLYEQQGGAELKRPGKTVAYVRSRAEANRNRREKTEKPCIRCRKNKRASESKMGGMAHGLPGWVDGYWDIEPDIPRVAEGVADRIERLKCLGNAVVPQQFYPIFRAIADCGERELC